MKLFLCGFCEDIVRLIRDENRYCMCKKSFGRYLDSNQAVYGGNAIPIGMHNGDLIKAVGHWACHEKADIRAWTFAKDAPTYTREETKGTEK